MTGQWRGGPYRTREASESRAAVSAVAPAPLVELYTSDLAAPDPGSPGSATTQFVLLLVFVPLIVLVLLALYVVLAARQMVILTTYGLFPLLIAFWVADAGPLKYGKQVASKFFKAAGMLIPLGIVAAALFNVSTTFMEELSLTATTAGGTTGAAGADAAFQSSAVTDVVLAVIPIPAVSVVVITIMLGPLQSIGASVSGAAGAAKAGAAKLGRRGKAALGGIGGGAAGGGLRDRLGDGMASGGVVAAGDDGGTSTRTLDNTAPEPEQTTVAQYDDGATPETAAFEGGHDPSPDTNDRHYADPDTNPFTAAENKQDFLQNHGYDLDDEVAGALYDMKAAQADGQDPLAKSLVKEMMGPAGGAIGGAAVAAAGLGSVPIAGAAASVAAAGTVAYTAKQAIDQGSVREGFGQTLQAGTDIGKIGFDKVETAGRQSYEKATGSSGSVDSHDKYD